jgi:hypothetical protein
MSVVTSVRTRRLEEGAPPSTERLPPTATLAPLLTRVGDVRLDLFGRLHVDQRADHGTRFEAVGDLHRTRGLGQSLGEGIVDAVLHQDPVGAHAGLPGIAIFRGDRPRLAPLLPSFLSVFREPAELGERYLGWSLGYWNFPKYRFNFRTAQDARAPQFKEIGAARQKYAAIPRSARVP